MSNIDGITHCKTHYIIEQACIITIIKQKMLHYVQCCTFVYEHNFLLFKECIHQDDIVMYVHENNKTKGLLSNLKGASKKCSPRTFV